VEILRRLRGQPKWPDIAPVAIQRWLQSIGMGPALAEDNRVAAIARSA
jgi:hypothetical protein